MAKTFNTDRLDSVGLKQVWGNMKQYISTYTEPFNIDKVYPVGAIYMSVISTNPGNLFGGTWERIQNQFLLASGGDYPAGSSGGSPDAVLMTHTHTQAAHTHYTLKGEGWGYPVYSTTQSGISRTKVSTSSGSRYAVLGTSGASNADGSGLAFGGQLRTATPTINSTGSKNNNDGIGKNMPPYLAVYVWKRTF